MALGVHLSTAGGLKACLDQAEHLGIQAFQIYTRSTRRWFTPPLEPEEVVGFRQRGSRLKRKHLLALASPLINLASPEEPVYQRSMDALYDELMRAEALGMAWVILSCGNHGGQGEEAGVRRVLQGLNRSLERTRTFKCGLLLETAAGEEHDLGATFEQVGRIRKRVDDGRRVGVCVDTARVFAAGYDLRDAPAYNRTIEELGRVIGLRHVHAFHLNDAVFPLGSRRTGGAPVGDGEIGGDGFSAILSDTRFQHLPMILETAAGADGGADLRQLELAAGLAGAANVHSE